MPPNKVKAQKKEQTDKIVIKQFPDGSHFWVDGKHYYLDENNQIQFAAGGIDTEELREALKAFVKRNKKVFQPRNPSIFETEEIEYSIVTFGKYSGESTFSIFSQDVKYARWMYDNVTDEKIKQELKILLKK